MQSKNPLPAILRTLEVSQRDLAREAEISLGVVNRLVAGGQWPKRRPNDVCSRICKCLKARGAKAAWLKNIRQSVQASNKAALATVGSSAKAIPNQSRKNIMEDSMLLNFTPLSQEAKKFFGLTGNPFTADMQSLDDVFMSKSIRYARACIEDTARNHGFMALIGESGAGKTTLMESFEEKLKTSNDDIVLCKPYVLAMERNDKVGKTLKSRQIAECIITTLSPDTVIRSSMDALFRQLHKLLIDSRRTGRRQLIVIEEAHCMPTTTLKHLKRFLELRDGLQRLVGIALIAQPELKLRLTSHDPEVREVMQRCELVELPPLDNDLKDYLQHKLGRVGIKFENVFAADAVDAMRARLTYIPRGGKPKDALSMCHPLVVNNLASRAMNEAAATEYGKVDAQVIAGC